MSTVTTLDPTDRPTGRPADRPTDRSGTSAPGRVQYPLGWLRALAALTVVVFHAYQHNRTPEGSTWPLDGTAHQLMLGADLFVDLFFVLSGLVLWLPVAGAVLEGRSGRPGRVLLLRRVARLVPLYATVVLVVWAVTNPTLPGHWQDLVLHLTFTQVYSDTYVFWTDGPAWSLAVEMHFYVVVALVAALLNAAVRHPGVARSRGARLALVTGPPLALVGAGLAYLVWMIHLHDTDPTDWSLLFSPVSRGADFGLGMLLAVLVAAGVRLPRAVRGVCAATGVGALVVLVLSRPHDLVGQWWNPLYAAALVVALAAVVLHDGPWPAVFSWRPLVFLGSLGYGIYLLHEPVMRFLTYVGALPPRQPGLVFLATAVLVAVPTVALAWLSARTVEAGGLRLLAVLTHDGKGRDYYAHVAAAERDAREDRRTAPAQPPEGTGRSSAGVRTGTSSMPPP